MSVNSKAKGKRGELYVAGKFKEYGYQAHRTNQFCGYHGDADIEGVPYLHCEIKFVQALNISKAMEQAIRDKREGEIPTVFHKKNREPLMVTMLWDDWIQLYKEWEAGRCVRGAEEQE